MNPRHAERIKQMRARVLVRSWEYRQRRHAHGVWFRLRRVLADAREVYLIPREEADKLIAEGYRAEPVGQELEPPKRLVFVPPERARRIARTQPVPVRLGEQFFSAENLALIPFEWTASMRVPRSA